MDIESKEMLAKMLLKRLTDMLEDNIEGRKAYKHLEDLRLKSSDRYRFVDSLNQENYKIFCKQGKIHSNTALQRARIDLNKLLIEIERGC